MQENSKPTLDACPCCGGRPQMTSYQPYDGYMGEDTEYRVRCTACGLEITRDSVPKVIYAWNNRTQLTEPGFITRLVVDALTVAASEWKTSHPCDAKTAEALKNYIINGVKFLTAGKE